MSTSRRFRVLEGPAVGQNLPGPDLVMPGTGHRRWEDGLRRLQGAVEPGASGQRLQVARCTCPICSAGRRSPLGRSGAATSAGSSSSTASTASTLPLVSLQSLADYLTTGYWQEAGTYTRRYNLAASGPGAKNGVITYNLTGWADDSNGITADRQALVREVFKLYSSVLGVSFREVSGSGGDIRFTDNDAGAYAYMASGWYADSSRTTVAIDFSVVNVESAWYDGRSNYNTYTPQTFFHEVGHALGLGHQGQYNYAGTPLTYGGSAQFANDSWQATMMSYWDQSQNPTTGASFAWLQTPMTVDWIALNDLYGSQGYGVGRAFQADTVYGVGTNISASVSQIWNQFSTYAGSTAWTLVDGGGYDTLDVSNFTADQVINLSPSQPGSVGVSASSIGGRVGNLSIAVGTTIEAANGGAGNDRFYGNIAANTFHGQGGNDSFHDSQGSDIYFGDGGNDWLYFGESIDQLTCSLVGDALFFSRRSGSDDVDQVWSGLENLSFNGVTYTWNQLLATLSDSSVAPLQPTATLSLAGNAGGGVNEGTSVSIDIATTPLTPGAPLVWQLSGAGISTADFLGLSSLMGRVSTDGAGTASLTLSIRSDALTEGPESLRIALFSDDGLTRPLADLTLSLQDTSLTPVVPGLTLWGTAGSDQLSGGAGGDRLTGVLAGGTTAAAMGARQIDSLTGRSGADVFVLGDGRGVFYDDRIAGKQGASDYARIRDFQVGEDRLQLRSDSYIFSVVKGSLGLYWDRNSSGRLETSGSNRDELIAVLPGVSSLSGSDILWV
ncbi:MAG: M10 family metallopeptidase [Cyanobium sp.]